MKIKITEIEANAEDLRGSQTLGAAISNAMRNAFSSVGMYGVPNSQSVCDDDGEESEDE